MREFGRVLEYDCVSRENDSLERTVIKLRNEKNMLQKERDHFHNSMNVCEKTVEENRNTNKQLVRTMRKRAVVNYRDLSDYEIEHDVKF